MKKNGNVLRKKTDHVLVSLLHQREVISNGSCFW
jgi:hypothetical protein